MHRRLKLRDANRLRRNADFVEIRQSSKPYRCPFFALHFRIRALDLEDADASFPRIGISVSRRIGNAVCRNRLKRRLREMFRLRQHLIQPGCDIVISLRPPARGASYAQLEERLAHALKYKRLLRVPVAPEQDRGARGCEAESAIARPPARPPSSD